MTVYPEPEHPSGHPFTDPNFKLVVLENLLDQEIIDLGTPAELATHLLKRDVDLEHEGYELIPQCLEYLYRYPLTTSVLEQVNGIVIDGSLEIYEFAFYFWGGDVDVFDIESLDGIQQCPNITSYWESAMCNDSDLSRLAQLEKLKSVSLALRTRESQYKNLDSLLSLPELESFELCKSTVEQSATPKVIDALRNKGVEVKVSPC